MGRIKGAGYKSDTQFIKNKCGEEVFQKLLALLTGYFGRAIEISGGKAVEVTELSCAVKGAPYCEWRIA